MLYKRYENTKFYHNSVIAYQARNAVTYLIDDQENQVLKGIEIKGLEISYYQKLLGEENNEVVSLSVEVLRKIFHFNVQTVLLPL